MKTYHATATRDGKFWLVHVPEVDRYTQARSLREVDVMAHDLIAIMTDEDPAEFNVLVEAKVPAPASRLLEQAHHQRRIAEEASAAASTAHRAAARVLADGGMTVRDIGYVLGVSHQRVHQLLHAADVPEAEPDPVTILAVLEAKGLPAASGKGAKQSAIGGKHGRQATQSKSEGRFVSQAAAARAPKG